MEYKYYIHCLLKHIPFDNNYTDTLLIDDLSNYFNGKCLDFNNGEEEINFIKNDGETSYATIFLEDSKSFVSEDNLTIVEDITYSQALKCNYVLVKEEIYNGEIHISDKIYYYFIINNKIDSSGTLYLELELDVMMTYGYSFILNQNKPINIIQYHADRWTSDSTLSDLKIDFDKPYLHIPEDDEGKYALNEYSDISVDVNFENEVIVDSTSTTWNDMDAIEILDKLVYWVYAITKTSQGRVYLNFAPFIPQSLLLHYQLPTDLNNGICFIDKNKINQVFTGIIDGNMLLNALQESYPTDLQSSFISKYPPYKLFSDALVNVKIEYDANETTICKHKYIFDFSNNQIYDRWSYLVGFERIDFRYKEITSSGQEVIKFSNPNDYVGFRLYKNKDLINATITTEPKFETRVGYNQYKLQTGITSDNSFDFSLSQIKQSYINLITKYSVSNEHFTSVHYIEKYASQGLGLYENNNHSPSLYAEAYDIWKASNKNFWGMEFIGLGSKLTESGLKASASIPLANPYLFFNGAFESINASTGVIQDILKLDNLQNSPSSRIAQGTHFNFDLVRRCNTQPYIEKATIKDSLKTEILRRMQRFGYRTYEYLVLSETLVRNRFNYVKTNITSLGEIDYQNFDIPLVCVNKLINIFNRGIRLWHDYSRLFDYTYPNNERRLLL